MADKDITALFETKRVPAGGNIVSTEIRLLPLLASVIGAKSLSVDGLGLDPTLVQSLKLSSVGVSSTFAPLDCQAKGSSDDSALPQDDDFGTPGFGDKLKTPVSFSPETEDCGGTAEYGQLFSQIAALASDIAHLKTMIATGTEPLGGMSTEVADIQGNDAAQCFRYLNTSHGPLGLFRRRILARASVGGAVELLGGLKSFAANADVLTYLEYSVNTFLQGQASWNIDDKSKDPVFGPPTTLPFTKKCDPAAPEGGDLKRCGSDVVSGNMRVVIRFKKIFIGEIIANAGTPTANVDIVARLTSLSDESFTGIVSFTHMIPPNAAP